MPNWATNKVTLTLPTAESTTFFTLTAMAGDQLDFGWFFTAIQQERNCRDNNLEHLGTKWEFEIYDLEFSDHEITFFTDTAWSPPAHYLTHLAAVFKKLYDIHLDFDMVYYEPNMELLGRYSSTKSTAMVSPELQMDINVMALNAADNDEYFDIFIAIETILDKEV